MGLLKSCTKKRYGKPQYEKVNNANLKVRTFQGGAPESLAGDIVW